MLPLRFWAVLLAWGVSNYARQTTGRISLHHSQSRVCRELCECCLLHTLKPAHTYTQTQIVDLSAFCAHKQASLKMMKHRSPFLFSVYVDEFAAFLVSSFILQPHCVHLCVLNATPCLSALRFINNENVVFSVSLFSSYFSFFFFLLPFFFLRSLSCHRGIQVDRALHSECQIRYSVGFGRFCFTLYVDFDNSHYLCWRVCQCFHQFSCLLLSQPPGGIPGSQPLLPNSLDPTRPQGTAGTVLIVSGLLRSHIIMMCLQWMMTSLEL